MDKSEHVLENVQDSQNFERILQIKIEKSEVDKLVVASTSKLPQPTRNKVKPSNDKTGKKTSSYIALAAAQKDKRSKLNQQKAENKENHQAAKRCKLIAAAKEIVEQKFNGVRNTKTIAIQPNGNQPQNAVPPSSDIQHTATDATQSENEVPSSSIVSIRKKSSITKISDLNNIMFSKYFDVVMFDKNAHNMAATCKCCDPNFKHRIVHGDKGATSNFLRHLEVSILSIYKKILLKRNESKKNWNCLYWKCEMFRFNCKMFRFYCFYCFLHFFPKFYFKSHRFSSRSMCVLNSMFAIILDFPLSLIQPKFLLLQNLITKNLFFHFCLKIEIISSTTYFFVFFSYFKSDGKNSFGMNE